MGVDPLQDGTKGAGAVPRVGVEIHAMKTSKWSEHGFPEVHQVVAVQLEPEELVQPVEGVSLEVDEATVRELQPDQLAEVGEGVVRDLAQGIGRKPELP